MSNVALKYTILSKNISSVRLFCVEAMKIIEMFLRSLLNFDPYDGWVLNF